MGSWGVGIKQDDTVLDVINAFEERLKAGANFAAASSHVQSSFFSDDLDDTVLARIGLAYAQWSYGSLEPTLLDAVRTDILSGAGLETWREAGVRELKLRQAVLRRFLERIELPNPRPKRLPRVVVRPPKFTAGDCLSVKLANGQFGAALVLAADHTDIEYGRNLIAVLEYMSPLQPTLDEFAKRNWLRLTHHKWAGKPDLAWYMPVRFRSEAKRLQIVGSLPILSSDPNDSNTYCGWHHLGQQVLFEMQWRSGTT